MSVCERINSEFGELFTCADWEQYVRIRTPFLYPDGDVIDVFYREAGNGIILTDLSETTRWLRSQTYSSRKTLKQKQLIQDICTSNRLEFYKGSIIARVEPGDSLASRAIELAQACLRVSDIALTFRAKAVVSFGDEIAEFLDERNVNYERNEKLVGRSGRGYVVDFHTFQANRSALVRTLATGSKSNAKNTTQAVLACWYELNHLKVGSGLRFVSLFDDSYDVWSSEDFALLGELSEIATWSNPDDFAEKLIA